MISFSESESVWERMPLGVAPEAEKTLVVVASAPGTAGTTEDILYDAARGALYRRRSWIGSSRSGPSGAVWFVALREAR
jgi:hypothetical protein